MESPMKAKAALVTGVSRPLGLGFAVARQLAERDYHVFVTARDLQRAEEVALELGRANHSATALRLDLADLGSIRQAADRVASTVGHLDVLVNNASHGPDFRTRSALDVDLDWARSVFAVDVLGCWGLVQALLPLLRRAPAARIVNVSSAGALQIGSKPRSNLLVAPAYALAKYTLNVLTTTLAAALAYTSILVNAVDPGSFASHPERGDDGSDPSAAESAKGVIWAATLAAGGPTGGFFRNGEPVCEDRVGRW